MRASARVKRLEKKIKSEFGPSTEGPTILAFSVMPGTPDECLVVSDEDNAGYRLLTQEEMDGAGTLVTLARGWAGDKIELLPTKKLRAKVRAYRAERKRKYLRQDRFGVSE